MHRLTYAHVTCIMIFEFCSPKNNEKQLLLYTELETIQTYDAMYTEKIYYNWY